VYVIALDEVSGFVPVSHHRQLAGLHRQHGCGRSLPGATLPLTVIEAGACIPQVQARSDIAARPVVSRDVLIRVR
jgi:hypothetical protein